MDPDTPMDPQSAERRTHRPDQDGDLFAERGPGALREGDDRARRNPAAIRSDDTEPYVALQYVARLFKIAAMVVVVALVAEIIAGIVLEGAGAVLGLLQEVIRGAVLIAVLWGAGDLTLLLIDVGHDVRAQRVLLGRLSARAGTDGLDTERDS
jgi:hypothetical protein